MRYPFTASEQSISIFFSGKMHSVPASNAAFEPLYDHLKSPDHDFDFIERLIDKPKMMARMTEGLVSVVGSTVYYAGTPIRSTLALKLLELLDAGFDVTPWARFMERVMANPSERSRECLFDFLDTQKTPLTEDGHFLAFKRVASDYKDIYTGTMDNTPGNVVEMPRERVNPDPSATCSYGLHVAASSYLGSYASAERNKTVVCKVDPADVVAVPRDYGFAKMRVCRYIVLGDAEEGTYEAVENSAVSYIGTETSVDVETAPSVDLDGKPICYNAVDFAANWRRDAKAVMKIGSLVSPMLNAVSDQLPANRFLVGEVTDIGPNGDGLFLEVEWQDGLDSDGLRYHRGDIAKRDVVVVTFIGTEETEEDEVAAAADEVEDIYDIYGQNASDEDEGADEVDDETSEMSFTRNHKTYTASEVTAGIKKHGQRGYSRLTGVPRTTLQDWVLKISALN